jgi:hypothetical protein
MLKHLDTDLLLGEGLRPMTPFSRHEIERLVIFVRLELYNHGIPCGPEAVRKRMAGSYSVKQLPSPRTIARIIARNGLTHGRTGWYDGDVN